MKLIAVETKDKMYLQDVNSEYSNNLMGYIINGEPAKLSFNKDWVVIDKTDSKMVIEKKICDTRENYRFELIDKNFVSDKVKFSIPRDEACYYDKYEGEWYWKHEYMMYESLYELVYDTVSHDNEIVEYEMEVVLQVDDINEPKYNYNIKSNDIEHQVVDTIIFPSIVIHDKPCKITSKKLYKIVRNYIKENINHDVAKVTSDYDFCFEVKKIIPLSEPYNVKDEILTSRGKSYAKRRFKTTYVDSKFFSVFEMTYSPENYRSYTPISEITANNEDELIKKVTNLCDDLIEMINEPVKECPCCKGRGVIIESDSK